MKIAASAASRIAKYFTGTARYSEMRYSVKSAVTIFIGFTIFACTRAEFTKPAASMTTNTVRTAMPDLPLADLMKSASVSKEDIRLHIDKSAFTLQVMADTQIIKTYPVVFGGNPTDDKRMEGDQRTPEGTFALRSIYPHNKWSKFLWINYPTDESKIKFDAAKAGGEIPSTATIGGEIGIHGVPEGCDHWIDQMQHWTLGCISLKNAHIDEIYDAVKVGTQVIIVK